MNGRTLWARGSGILLMAAVGLTALLPAHADDPQTLAPPVSRAAPAEGDAYDWQDVPRDERIPIVRAVFDHGGYRLYDANGQMILVPFVNGNLYVMRFGKTNGEMYFVNEDGGTPTLYLPENGYLENAAAAGARWYPFPTRYFYSRPVYVGPAPTWDAYITMGWYPGMVFYGGFCDPSPWRVGIVYRPMPSLSVVIGGYTWRRWDDYYGFSCATPRQRVVFVDRPVYRPGIVRSGGYPSWRRDTSGNGWNRRNDHRDDRRDDWRDNRRDNNDRFDRGGDRPRESSRPGGWQRNNDTRPNPSPRENGARPGGFPRNGNERTNERSNVTVFGDERRGGYGNRNNGSERSTSSDRRGSSGNRRSESGRDRERGRRP